jgi:hypothetical protein
MLFVAALIAATFASGAWCAGEILTGRVRAWWRTGRPIAANAVLLAAAVGVAVGLRVFLVPAHHAMYLDEPWYAEAACNLARRGRLLVCEATWSGTGCAPYGKAWGWPVLIAPWTFLAGCETSIGIHLNRVLGSATVLLVALAARCAGARWWQSVFAAALLAIHPVHVTWSATGETNVAAAAALLAGLCGALVYVRTGRLCGAALAASSLGLSTAIRPESFVPAMLSPFILALGAPARLSQRLLVGCAIGVACSAAAATGLQLWTMNESISGGAFLSLANIVGNVLSVARTESLLVHGVVALLAFAGAAVAVRSPQRAAAWLLLCTAVAAALVALAYDRFDERMLLGATVALLPLSGFIFDWRPPTTRPSHAMLRPLAAATVVLFLVLLWGRALLSASSPPETQVLETRIASRVARLPFAADSLFITEQPPVLAAAGMTHVMSTERALRHDGQLSQFISAGRPVYFLCDMYCEPGFGGVETPALCRRMLGEFALSPVAEESLHSRQYILYRVAGPAVGGPPAQGCPFPQRSALDG